MGPQKRSRLMTDADKRITAYHEAGHAIVAKTLPLLDPVQEVSIIPGKGGGLHHDASRHRRQFRQQEQAAHKSP